MGKPTIRSTTVALLALAACTASASQFVDRTTASGLVASTGIGQVTPIPGGGAVGDFDLVAHFGLGTSDRVDELRVEWPNGHRSRLFDLEADQLVRVVAEHVNLDGFE